MEQYERYVGTKGAGADGDDVNAEVSCATDSTRAEAGFGAYGNCRDRNGWWNSDPRKDTAADGDQEQIRSCNEERFERGAAAVAGDLACLAGYMAGYLKAAGATCAPAGSPQYHPHGHPGMGGHPHPGAPHPFALATHSHPHPHPLDHGLAAAFPQGQFRRTFITEKPSKFYILNC